MNSVAPPLNTSVENCDGLLIMLVWAQTASGLNVILLLHDCGAPVESDIITSKGEVVSVHYHRNLPSTMEEYAWG